MHALVLQFTIDVIFPIHYRDSRLVSEEVKSSTGSDDLLDGFSDEQTDIISQADHLNWYLEEIKDFIVEVRAFICCNPFNY